MNNEMSQLNTCISLSKYKQNVNKVVYLDRTV